MAPNLCHNKVVLAESNNWFPRYMFLCLFGPWLDVRENDVTLMLDSNSIPHATTKPFWNKKLTREKSPWLWSSNISFSPTIDTRFCFPSIRFDKRNTHKHKTDWQKTCTHSLFSFLRIRTKHRLGELISFIYSNHLIKATWEKTCKPTTRNLVFFSNQ